MTTYRVLGMTCSGCVRSLETALRRVNPEAHVSAELTPGAPTPEGKVHVEGWSDEAAIERAVETAGFEFGGRALPPA